MRSNTEAFCGNPQTTRHANPKHLLLQWHITDKCNLRCQHCYQDDYREQGVNFAQLIAILDQYEMLLASLGKKGKRLSGHINITGGEPFVREDFLHLLKEIRARRIPFAILTNGLLIDRATARFLKGLAPRFIQVSLEGSQARHDAIRGQGNYEQVLNCLRILRGAGIRTLVSFTAHRQNFRDFPHVAEVCQRYGVSRLWSDRLIPAGAANGSDSMALSPEETREFFTIMSSQAEKRKQWREKGGIMMHRALQFLLGGGNPYRCNAGHELITVMPDGTVFPCRRLPISAGNIFETSLCRIYRESTIFYKLRDPASACVGCETCEFSDSCRGGLRCLAYAGTGDPFRADPGCWRATNRGTAQ
ncbi:MAG: radical SAM protein [Candidatus Thiodiazotropha sp.]